MHVINVQVGYLGKGDRTFWGWNPGPLDWESNTLASVLLLGPVSASRPQETVHQGSGEHLNSLHTAATVFSSGTWAYDLLRFLVG